MNVDAQCLWTTGIHAAWRFIQFICPVLFHVGSLTMNQTNSMVGPFVFADFANLEQLILVNIHFVDLPFPNLRSCRRLKTLILDSCDVQSDRLFQDNCLPESLERLVMQTSCIMNSESAWFDMVQGNRSVLQNLKHVSLSLPQDSYDCNQRKCPVDRNSIIDLTNLQSLTVEQTNPGSNGQLFTISRFLKTCLLSNALKRLDLCGADQSVFLQLTDRHISWMNLEYLCLSDSATLLIPIETMTMLGNLPNLSGLCIALPVDSGGWSSFMHALHQRPNRRSFTLASSIMLSFGQFRVKVTRLLDQGVQRILFEQHRDWLPKRWHRYASSRFILPYDQLIQFESFLI